ncbi:MAG TPA: hypothetical protein VIQ22_02590 [Gammaproteobacteria bacterium]
MHILRTYGIVPLAAIIFGLTAPAALASSYLQELEAEAARSGGAQKESPATPDQKSRDWSASNAVESGDNIKAGLDKEGFEEVLQTNFYGSYLFYSTLDNNGQQRVFEDYNSDNNINSIRESIKRQMKN